jgi:hypothetical protein
MSIQFRQVPTYTVPLSKGENTTSAWYRYLQQNELGTPPSSEVAVTVTASPFVYTAPKKGFVIVTGGTVSLITFSRTTGTFYNTGQTSGTFPVASNDQLKVTYSVLPTTFIFVPL